MRKKGGPSKHGTTSSTLQCRICLSEGSETDNPLISPCKCSGTMRCVHFECLRGWLVSKRHYKKTETVETYSWRTLECELCKHPYPERVVPMTLPGQPAPKAQPQSKPLNLLDYETPDKNFMVLESLTSGTSKTVYVVFLESRRDVKMGRGNESDIRIADISVSRLHAQLKVTRNEVWLEDNNSKFGTLIQLRYPRKIPTDRTFYLQCSRTLVTINVRKRSSFFKSCFSGNADPHAGLVCSDGVHAYPKAFKYSQNGSYSADVTP